METKGLLSLQIMMFLLMGVGVVLRKKNIITKEGRNVLTDLVIDVILPCNIINAFQISGIRFSGAGDFHSASIILYHHKCCVL